MLLRTAKEITMSNLLRIKELEAQVERKDKYILKLEQKLKVMKDREVREHHQEEAEVGQL